MQDKIDFLTGQLELKDEPSEVLKANERKRAEELLGRSENLYKTLAEAAQDLIFIIGRDDRVIYTNNYAANAFGKRPEDIIGMLRKDLFQGKISERQKEHLAMVFCTGEPALFEDTVIYGNREIWINTRLVPIRGDYGRVEAVLGISRDITERKRTEEALRESELTKKVLMDGVPEAMFLMGRNGNILDANSVFSKLLNKSREELIGVYAYDLIDRKIARFRKARIDDVFSTGRPSHFEDIHEDIIFDNIIAPIFSLDGKVDKVAVIAIDITERKRAEEALQESENKFRVLAETSPAAIFLYQGEKYVYVNPTAETLTGCSLDELLAGDAWEWIHPEFRDMVKDRASKRQKGEPLPTQYEVKYLTKDGREGWADFSAGLIEYRGKPAGLATAFDVTKRKRAEAALRESEERLQLCIATAGLGFYDWDVVNDRHVWSPETYDIYGIPQDTPMSLDYIARLIVPEDRRDDIVAEELDPAKSHGEYNMEYRIVRPSDGAVRWVYTRTRVFFNGEGAKRKAVRELGIVQDMTEHKRREKDLLDTKARAELYLDLMGHDINNLLQVALGYLELSRDMPQGKDKNNYLDKPVEVLQRCSQLIGNVRKLQKLQDDTFQLGDIDVIPVLKDIKREYGGLPDKHIMLNINGYAHCYVKANELLHDVYANLVTNAIKHTGENTDINIDLDITQDNGIRYCHVMVEDNGQGIPDDKKATIFNRTLKGSNKAKGMGLGLYIVKTLVDSYGGRVTVEDRVPGDYAKGAKFVVMLPAIKME